MPLTREQVLEILYPGSVEGRTRRFTQDTPILPDVWLALAGNTTAALPLLLTPHRQSSAAELAKHMRERMLRAGETLPRITYNDSHVLAWLTFSQLIRIALPLSSWWARDLGTKHVSPEELTRFLKRPNFVELLMEPARQDDHGEFPENVLNFIRIIGCIALQEPIPPRAKLAAYLRRAVAKVQHLISGMDLKLVEPPPLWNIFTNRRATAALLRSRLTVKADAALQLFGINCKGVRVAVIDSGIDAKHPAFRRENKEQESRVIKTLDFRRLQELTARDGEAAAHLKIPAKDRERIQKDIEKRLQDGRPLDWPVLEPALAIPQGDDYRPPVDEHGTHVAGIIGANWPENVAASGEPEPLVGMCPDIELYDLRVLDDAGEGDEFSILAALQYVRYLNQRSGRLVIHVVNISISLPHEPSSFACGATPICEEVNRLVSSGVVVVVAAGNSGYVGDSINNATDFRAMSLTDPGNAHQAITVGATHRSEPFRYGVSYFSSRGPTGDGRAKPDLVAPGEGIRSPIPGAQSVVLDGTSMAAPHVAGAAALLIARHRELAGDPERIKTILCRTATDLGRVRDFQGAGLLDILRALQSL